MNYLKNNFQKMKFLACISLSSGVSNTEKLYKKPGKPFRISGLLCAIVFMAPLMVLSQTVTESRDLEPFTAIEAGGIFTIELTQGDHSLVEIETEENLMERVETQVQNGVLKLNLKGTPRNATLKVHVVNPSINEIKLSGAANLKGLNEIYAPVMKLHMSGASRLELMVNTESLTTRGSGAVNIQLQGRAHKHNLVLSGASQVRALDLETHTSNVNTSGASNARVWASNLLEVKASGTSNVSYEQEPNSLVMNLSGMSGLNNITASEVRAGVDDHGDTLKLKLGNRDLWVIEDEKSPKVKWASRGGFKSNWSGFELGINGYLTPDHDFSLGDEAESLELRYPKSVVVNINLFQQSFPIIRNNLGLVTGFGIGFNNYRFDNQYTFIPDKDGLIPVLEEERVISKNKFTVTHLNIPLMLEYQTGGRRQSEKFHIAGGMILGTRIGTHAKYVYDDSGKKRKEKNYNDFNMQPFRFDATGRIGWGRVNLFATYALNSLFKTNRGPELYPFSVGMRVVNW